MALAALLVLLAPGASAAQVDVTVSQEREVIAVGEELTFRVEATVSCEGETHTLELHLQGSNAFDFTVLRDRWPLSAADCAQGPRTLGTDGTFRFNERGRLFPPLVVQQVRIDAWLTVGEDVRAANYTMLRVAPDHLVQGGAVLSPPRDARISEGRLMQEHTWTVTNHGTGAFTATASVHEVPDWVHVVLPGPMASDGRATGSQANVTMQVSMPEECPAASAVVTVAFHLDATDPRSRAGQEIRVQGIVPCRPDLAAGTPGWPLPLALAAVALAAHRRAAQQHKR